MDARERLTRARTALVLGHPFFGLLALRLRIEERPSIGTCATDGRHLWFNPEYVNKQSDKQLIGLVAHEVMHCVAGHAWRRGGRDHKLWNVACDFAIDYVLVKAKFDVPDALLNPRFNGLSAEQIYAELVREEPGNSFDGGRNQSEHGEQGGSNGGQGESEKNNEKPSSNEKESSGSDGKDKAKGSGGDQDSQESESGQSASESDAKAGRRKSNWGDGPTKGEVLDAPSDTALQDQSEWRQAVQAAAEMAKGHGKMPAGLEWIIESELAPKLDWRAMLKLFVQQVARDDYNWQRPSQRYLPLGVYMPSMRSPRIGPVVFLWDTSGSCYSRKTQESIASEATSLLQEAEPEKLYVAYCDASVHKVEELEPGDNPKWRPVGGGGTDFRPVFEWVEKEGIEPVCMVAFTDCFGNYPKEAPSYPVLWMSMTPINRLGGYMPPFGEVIEVEE